MASYEDEFRERMTAFRKRRALFNAAARAVKRSADRSRGGALAARNYLEAARIIEQGANEGIKVGGIQRYDQMAGNIGQSMQNDFSTMEWMNSLGSGQPQAAPQAVQPLSMNSQDNQTVAYPVSGYGEDMGYGEVPGYPTANPLDYTARRSMLRRY